MPQPYDASPVSVTSTSGTLTAAAATVAAANPNRRGAIVSNNSDTVMTLGIGETGTASVGVSVPAGQAIAFYGDHTPTALLSLFCAGTAKAYTVYTW